MKNILCYGDSNTWGFVAGSLNIKTLYCKRFSRDISWTGIAPETIKICETANKTEKNYA